MAITARPVREGVVVLPTSAPRVRVSRFWAKLLRSHSTTLGLVVVALVALMALFGPALAPVDPLHQELSLRRAGLQLTHPFGMDEFGRDILSRVLWGARNTAFAGVTAVVIGLLGGVPLGVAAGFLGRWVDEALMGLVDAMLALPYFLLSIVLVAIMQPSLQSATIAVGITLIPNFARIVRGAVIGERHRDYILAARGMGCTSGRIVLRHVLPNVTAPIIVAATVSCATTILSTAGLGFLGLGAQPPLPEWGLMVAGGRAYVLDAPHIITIPGLAIGVLVLSINLVGDGLRDALDPRSS